MTKEPYNLFLDDNRGVGDINNPKANRDLPWIIAPTGDVFKYLILHRGLPAFISFDWDLGLRSENGADCLRWLIDTQLKPKNLPMPPYKMHSGDSYMARHMHEIADNYNSSLKQHEKQITATE